MIDPEKRKRVMTRSMRLGHCICDPQKTCPCELFEEKNICLCAGERLESPTGSVRLTRLVEKAGCASKIDQAFLKQVLKDLPAIEDPNVLVGVPAGDDAGIYDIGNGKALVQTVDVFTPSVDDPYMFGQVAAANSVSDIYAMGGMPLTALSVLGFPVHKIPDEVMSEILRGGIDKMKEAGVAVIGGHSINDDQIKAGFAVTGIIEKDDIVTNSDAQPGDVLILTKPLGTGIIAFAAQIDKAQPESIRASGESMTSLNKTAAQLMVEFGAHACTDVTGFSLLGHLTEMAARSGVEAEIIWDDIPLLPGVLQYVADGILPGAVERNKESCGRYVAAGDNVTQDMVDLCYDAQTSGGLLICIAQKKARQLLSQLHKKGISQAAIIGSVIAAGSGKVTIRTTQTRRIPIGGPEKHLAKPTTVPAQTSRACCGESREPLSPCCSDPSPTEASCCEQSGAAGNSPTGDNDHIGEIQRQFRSFLGKAGEAGSLDAHTKQAMAIALSVLAKCEPCLKIHINKALKKGFTLEQIDEAAWLAIAFGGSPIMMFYNEVKKSL